MFRYLFVLVSLVLLGECVPDTLDERNIQHIVCGLDPGTYRAVCGFDTLSVPCEGTLMFMGRVVSPTHIVREVE